MLKKIIRIVIIVIITICTLVYIISCSRTKKVVTDVKEFKTDAVETKLETQTPRPIETTPIEMRSIDPNRKLKLPILLYHSVTDKTWGYTDLHVSPKEFDQQMKYLKDNNYTSLNFSELENANQYEKPIIITLDDGYENNYTEVYPILKKYNIKATIFVCEGNIGKTNVLKKEQIAEMSGLVDIQSHTITHPDLTKIDNKSLEKELKESKEKLQEITGKEINTLAYPAGQYNEYVLEITRKYYKYAVIARNDGFYTGEDKYTIKRLYISRNTPLNGFITMINIHN